MGVVRRPVDDDDEDNDITPTASTKPADDDDGLDEEDENEDTGRGTAILTGRQGARATKAAGSTFADEFRFEKGKKHLVKFLEDESFASYRQHWVEGQRKKSYICIGRNCPLCLAGDQASGKFAFNVYDYEDRQVKALITGPVLLEALEDAAKDTKTGQLSSGYWKLSRSGKGGKTSYGVAEVKERDLEEDYGLDPDDARGQLDGLVLYKPSIFQVPSVAKLREVAKSLNDDDVDQDDDDDDE